MPNIHFDICGNRDTTTGPYGRRVYCGGESDLTDEHIIPEAIGGRAILLKASCPKCKDAIDRFESQCHNQMFAAVRAQLGIRKTKARGRRGKFPVTVTVRGERQRASTPIDHHPTMLHLVSFAPPGILSHQPPSKDFTDTRWWAWRLGDERAFREKLDEIRLTTRAEEIHLEGVFLAQPFGRYLAKIAHHGDHGFRPGQLHSHVAAHNSKGGRVGLLSCWRRGSWDISQKRCATSLD
jgi:hypothetical protein